MRQVCCLIFPCTVIGICLPGCALDTVVQPAPAVPDDVPGALQVVLDDAQRFAMQADDPLLNSEPGTVVDELQLDGCWGAATLAELTFDDVPAGAIYYTLEFESGGGTFESTLWNVFLLPPDPDALGGEGGGGSVILQQIMIGGVSSGDFAIVGENQVILEAQRERVYSPIAPPSDGEAELPDQSPVDYDASDYQWYEEDPPQPLALEFLATLSGDQLLMHFGPVDREAVDPADEVIYVRFDCPN